MTEEDTPVVVVTAEMIEAGAETSMQYFESCIADGEMPDLGAVVGAVFMAMLTTYDPNVLFATSEDDESIYRFRPPKPETEH